MSTKVMLLAVGLVAIGLGNTRPISKERPKNRRVEFHITSAIPDGWKVKK